MDGWMFFAFTCRQLYFLCIYIYLYFSYVYYLILLYIHVFCSFDKKLETQKSNTLKSAFPINSDGSWSDLTNCSSNMGSKASSCCVVFFLGGVEKNWTWSLQKDFWVFHVFPFDVVSCLYFWGFFNLLSPSLSNYKVATRNTNILKRSILSLQGR